MSVAVGANPQGCCYDSGTGCIFVLNYGDPSVTKVNATTGAVVGTYAIATPGYGICSDGAGNIWLNVTGHLIQMSAASGSVLNTFVVAGTAGGICFDANSGALFMAAASTVKKVSTAGSILSTIVCAGTMWGVCSDNAGFIYSPNSAGTLLYKMSNVSGTSAFTSSATVGSGPQGCCYEPVTGTVWTANATANNVTKVVVSTMTPTNYSIGFGTNLQGAAADGTGNVWFTNTASFWVTSAASVSWVGNFVKNFVTPTLGCCWSGSKIWGTDAGSAIVAVYPDFPYQLNYVPINTRP